MEILEEESVRIASNIDDRVTERVCGFKTLHNVNVVPVKDELTMKSRVIALAVGIAFALAGCRSTVDRIEAVNLHEIASPAAVDSGQPNLAVGPGGEMYLSWMETTEEGSSVLKFAQRTGDGWSPARTIVQDYELLVNYADFPSLLAIGKNLLAAHWMSFVPESEGYNVNIALSSNGGETWSKPVVPHRDGTPTEHGFVSMVPDPSGGVAAIWFDSRKLSGGSVSDDVAMMVARIELDGTAGPETVIDDRVCECCQTSAIAVPGGILAAYRDRSNEEIRDIAIVEFDGRQWSKPRIVFADNWEISACPINGPALAAQGRNVAVAWFTAVNDEPKVQAVISTDGGDSFGQPFQIDDGKALGRVDVAMLDSGGALVSWLEQTDQGAEVRARAIQPDGSVQPSIVVGATGAGTSSGFPRMKRDAGTIVFAWTDSNQVRVRTAVLDLKN